MSQWNFAICETGVSSILRYLNIQLILVAHFLSVGQYIIVIARETATRHGSYLQGPHCLGEETDC